MTAGVDIAYREQSRGAVWETGADCPEDRNLSSQSRAMPPFRQEVSEPPAGNISSFTIIQTLSENKPTQA